MKNDYRQLKLKILRQVLLIFVISVVAGSLILYLLVDGIFQDPFARLCIAVFQKVFKMEYSGAQSVYYSVFSYNKGAWVAAGFSILLIVSFYMGMRRFTRYFQEVNNALDHLVAGDLVEISLSPEMGFMEKKLNSVKTDLEERTRAAKEAEQRKNDLIVYLAHDIKTPLTSVIGYLSLLDEAQDMPVEQRAKYTNITLEKAYRLEHLINEFFEITRFNLQTIELQKEYISLKIMLEQMADEFYPSLAPDGKEIQLDIPDSVEVLADADKLARVFNNIIKNAIAYSHSNSSIRVCARSHDNQVMITFTNQGKTIPKQQLQSIFEKFFRLDSSRSTQSGGAGLGLAIAKEIVAAHNGFIRADSENGETAFTVILPL